MSVLVWLIVPVLVIISVVSAKVWRERRPSSLEAHMREFKRGLDALDPANDPLKRAKAARTKESEQRGSTLRPGQQPDDKR